MSSFIQNVFPRPSRADEVLPFTETLAAPSCGATAVHIRPCPIRRCRQHIGTLSGGKPLNRAEPGNSGTFNAKSDIVVLSAERYWTAKIWSPAPGPPQGR